jgi:quinol-cytochrome oxidoreductase complex cytochrome b subunit
MFAVVGIILALLAVTIWPFIDRKADNKKAMRIRAIGVAVFVVLAIVLTIWGEVS